MKNVVNIEHLQVEHLKVAEKLQIYATYRIIYIYIYIYIENNLLPPVVANHLQVAATPSIYDGPITMQAYLMVHVE
jgi:hypothetical protein